MHVLLLLSFFVVNFEVSLTFLHKGMMVHNFFKLKSLNMGVFLTCKYSQQKQVSLRKLYTRDGYRLMVLRDLQHMKTIKQHLGVIVDTDCSSNSVNAHLLACGKDCLTENHFWLSPLESPEIPALLRNVDISINAEFWVIVPRPKPHEATDVWLVYDVYNSAWKHGGQLVVTEIGFYTASNGFKLTRQGSKYERRRNMTGTSFKSSIVLPADFEEPLSVYLKSDENRDVNTFNRFHHRIMTYCRDYYRFSLNVTRTDSWGYTLPNGSFDGMVGSLQHKRVDFGGSPVFLRADRKAVIDYCKKTWDLKSAFVFRNPKVQKSLRVFLRPFADNVWVVILSTIVVTSFFLKAVHHVENAEFFRNTLETSWSFVLLFNLGTFCQQSTSKSPTLLCGRILIISILIASILVYQFYSASIVSFLLMEPATTIKTLADMAKSKLKLGCEDILYIRDYFLHTTDPIASELYIKRIIGHNSSNFLSADDGLRLVKDGQYAFSVETATAYPIIQRTYPGSVICELKEVPLLHRNMHATVQKGSPFKEMLDFCLQRLDEYGVIHRELKHWHANKPECINSRNEIPHIGLEDVYAALALLYFGMFLSLIILAMEFTHSKVRTRYDEALERSVIHPFVH